MPTVCSTCSLNDCFNTLGKNGIGLSGNQAKILSGNGSELHNDKAIKGPGKTQACYRQNDVGPLLNVARIETLKPSGYWIAIIARVKSSRWKALWELL
jgi:hypothetical protein